MSCRTAHRKGFDFGDHGFRKDPAVSVRRSFVCGRNAQFFVVFREGFETVLFYEALLLDSPPFWVFSGFLIGVAGTIFIAWLLLKLGRKLPIEKFFAATGILLMILALVFTGFGMRGLQTAGVIESTPVPHFPESTFLQLYLGIFPTWESLMAQAALLLMFLVGVLGIVVVARKNRAATPS
ncbi:FTR1 family protein [Hydrogenophilus hirschii]